MYKKPKFYLICTSTGEHMFWYTKSHWSSPINIIIDDGFRFLISNDKVYMRNYLLEFTGDKGLYVPG